MLRTAVKWVSDPNNPQPGVLGCGVRRGTHCAPAALRSNNHGESVDEAGMSCGTPATPRPARPRRIQKGWGANSPSGRRCARPGVLGAQGARVGGRAQRWPVWLSGFGFPSGCAEERSGQRIRARDCLSEASSSETPLDASTAGCPVAKRRGRRQWGRPFFGDFLSAKRKKVTAPPGALPGSRPMPRHTARSTNKPQLRRAQPERAGVLSRQSLSIQ